MEMLLWNKDWFEMIMNNNGYKKLQNIALLYILLCNNVRKLIDNLDDDVVFWIIRLMCSSLLIFEVIFSSLYRVIQHNVSFKSNFILVFWIEKLLL